MNAAPPSHKPSSPLDDVIAHVSWLTQAGRFAEAAPLSAAILRTHPQEPTALFALGMHHLQSGRAAEAERGFAALLDARPQDAAAWAHRGLALAMLRRSEEALSAFSRAIELRPMDGMPLWFRARTLAAMGRRTEALHDFDRACRLAPTHEPLRIEALKFVEVQLQRSPDDRDALRLRGVVFGLMRDWSGARATWQALLQRAPTDADALLGMAEACLYLDHPQESLDWARQVDGTFPARKYGSLFLALFALGRFAEAEVVIDQALAVDPTNASLHWSRALLLLLCGRMVQAWADFEWRWESSPHLQSLRHLPERLWDGRESVAGKTILLHSEQGFGDAIQFARYASLLAARGAKVLIGAHPPLKSLLGTVAGVGAVVCNDDAMPQFDLHCPLISLPARFATDVATIPASVPYLRAEPKHVERWQRQLGAASRLRVGLCWFGNPTHNRDFERSLRLEQLEPILRLPCEFICLSKELRQADQTAVAQFGIRHFVADFDETAALMQHLDLVISVDTSIAHLAGALARPLWLMLSFVPDWRWLIEREDSPWYPTARLFRQASRGDWSGPVQRIAGEVAALAAKRRQQIDARS